MCPERLTFYVMMDDKQVIVIIIRAYIYVPRLNIGSSKKDTAWTVVLTRTRCGYQTFSAAEPTVLDVCLRYDAAKLTHVSSHKRHRSLYQRTNVSLT